MIESLFEEKVLGNLTDERFKKPTYKYEDEQLELKEKFWKTKKRELDVNGSLDIVKKYSQIENLTVDILNELIDKIIVHHSETHRWRDNSEN